MVFLFLFCFTVGAIATAALMIGAKSHAFRYDSDKPQRFHVGHISRLGGLGVAFSLASGLLLASLSTTAARDHGVGLRFMDVLLWSAVVLPSVLAGAYEDVTQRLAVRYRLVLTLLSAVLGCWLLGLSVTSLGVAWIDVVWTSTPFLGIAVALLAVAGLPHAFNLIDGYNGLAAAVAILVSMAMTYVSLQVGDRELASVLMCLIGATAGFFVWNYPRGMIFAGDCGAYLWGTVIGVASLMLVQRHAQVSPWFPMLLLIYPVWETIFSIYRKLARGGSPGVADALHFHQLIYRRIVRGVFHDDESRRILMRNNRTSPYLWGFTLLTVAPAVLFWRNSAVLMLFCGLFIVTYVAAYLMIVRFKVPSWLRR